MSGIPAVEKQTYYSATSSCSAETLERNLMKEKQRRREGKREEEHPEAQRKRKFLLAPAPPALLQVEKQVDRKDCALVNARNPKTGGYHAMMRA